MLKQGMVSILVLVCAARIARANDWTELGSDSAQSRDSSEVSGPVFAPSWSYALNSGPIVATPVSSGGSIVVAGSNGAVSALKATDGSLLWNRSLAMGVRATPTVSREQVAVSTMGGMLYSLGLADGGIVWQRTFGGQNYSSPQLVKGATASDADTIILGAGFPSQDVWRFNALTGEPVWQTANGAIASLTSSTASVVGNHVVIGMNGGRFQSLDLATGAAGWKLDASGDVYMSSPLVVGNHVYMFPGDKQSQVYAVDASSGAPVAGFPVAIPDLMPVPNGQMFGFGPAVSSPMTIGGLIIVQMRRQDMLPSAGSFKVVMREWVAAIDPVSASVRWQHSLANLTAPNANGVPQLEVCPTPAGFSGVSGSYVAVSSSLTGTMAVLDAQTGQELWTTMLSSPGRSSPVFSNGQLLIATDDSVLHAFASTTNRAPSAPSMIAPSGNQAFSAGGTELDWQAASDPEGSVLSYVVRIEEEGHPETSSEASTAAGQAKLTATLQPNTAYVFAVRSRDVQGALSAWSVTQRIQLGDSTPSTTVGSGDGTLVGMAPPPPSAGGVTMPLPPAPPPSDGNTSPPSAPPATSPPAADGMTPPAPPSCAPATSPPAPIVTVTDPAMQAGTPSAAAEPAAAPEAAASMMPAHANDNVVGATTAVTVATPPATGTTSPEPAVTTASPAVASTTEADLANRGGCSVASRGGTSPASILGVALLALVVSRRSRRGAKVASDRKAA